MVLSRLIITDITLNNFKSYKGEHHIGPFHTNFSSIIGRNGSGKSNVLDSILFVFGKRAKYIRLKKLSELIYKSDEFCAKCCSVIIYFIDIISDFDLEDKENSQSINKNQFSVKREVSLKGASKYYINDKLCTFTDVISKFHSKGINFNNNRFLILQGEVEYISQMKPKSNNESDHGLLEYLEEIIGTNNYQDKIDKTKEELDILEESKIHSLSLFKVAEKEKIASEKNKIKAEEYLNDDLMLSTNKCRILELSIFELREEIREKENLIAELRGKVKHKKDDLENAKKKILVETLAIKKEEKEYKSINEKCEEWQSQFNAYEKEDSKLNSLISFKKKKGSGIKADIKELKIKIEEYQNEIKVAKERIPKLIKESDKINKEKEESEKSLESVYRKIQKETSSIKEKLDQKLLELVPYKEKVDEYKSNFEVDNSELNILKEEMNMNTQDLSELEKNYKEENKKFEEIKVQYNTLTKKHSFIKKQKEQNENNLKELNNLITKSEESLKISRIKYNEAKYTVSSNQEKNQLIKRIMEAKSSGLIKGIEGKLGDLGTVDSKYDIAISTATNAFNNIVVDNTETAQKCVSFLKKNNLGRTTFIILDKLTSAEKACRFKIRTPEHVPRLFDKIIPKKQKYLPAFYFVLRNTLFSENIDQAVRISNANNKRWRVVTANGELIDISGAMTGGGKNQRRGAMASKEVNLIALKSKFLFYEKRYINNQEEIKKKSYSLEKNINDLNQINFEISKCKIDINNHKSNINDLNKRILKCKSHSNSKKPIKNYKKLIENLSKKIENSNRLYKIANKEYSSLKLEIDQIETILRNKCGNVLDEPKKIIKELELKNNDLIKKISSLKAKLNINKDVMERKNKTIETLNGELVIILGDLKKIKSKSYEVEENASKIHKELSKCKKQRTKQISILEELKNKFKELDNGLSKHRMKIIEYENEISKHNKYINRINNNITIQTEKLNKKIEKMEKNSKLITEIRSTIDISIEEINNENKYKYLNDKELSKLNKDKIIQEIKELKQKMKDKSSNMNAIYDYKQKLKKYKEKSLSLEEILNKVTETKKKYYELRNERYSAFMKGLIEINTKLKEMYTLLTLGGDADLECVDSMDPFSEGVNFSVRPPRKTWKSISNLSGGEKTLSSLSLVFALHQYKPTPIYIMDEIDAALDYKNVTIVANYIKRWTKNAQFIIISLRNNMYECSDRCVGVYKTRNSSNSLILNSTVSESVKE